MQHTRVAECAWDGRFVHGTGKQSFVEHVSLVECEYPVLIAWQVVIAVDSGLCGV